MQADIHTGEDWLVAEFVARMNAAGEGPAAREAFREGFTRLRSRLEMYPVSGRPSVVFESAARTARALAAGCLPLGIAVAMHLYPLCVLQCMPLPLLSFARFQRAMLLRTIRSRAQLWPHGRPVGDSLRHRPQVPELCHLVCAARAIYLRPTVR